MSNELLPCPFCGAQAEHIHVYAGEEVVRCVESCVGFSAETFETAATRWNKRADTSFRVAVDGELFKIGSTADSYPTAFDAVGALIDWHVRVALDPLVSADATKLRNEGIAAAIDRLDNTLIIGGESAEQFKEAALARLRDLLKPTAAQMTADELVLEYWKAPAVHANADVKQAWREGCQYGLTVGRKDPAVQEAAYMRGYKGAQAISQMLLEAARDALNASARLFADEMTEMRLKMVQKALRNINAAIANGIGADVAQVYAAGWRKCAKWADRADLVADIGSPAYERDRIAAMVKLGGEQ